MTDHPITPPPELVEQWVTESWHVQPRELRVAASDIHIATQAARWGADQQLAEDAKWLDHNALNKAHLKIAPMGDALKEAMRPKPPSLKEQALAELEILSDYAHGLGCSESAIRRALEALPE